jgi:hypothetical protein
VFVLRAAAKRRSGHQGKSGECEADSRHATVQVTLLLAGCILNLIIRILPHE